MSWGHMGRHLFVAARNQLFTINVHQTIPSLQYLCQSVIAVNLKDKELTYDLHLPTKMKTSIVDSYSQIIQVCVQAQYIITITQSALCFSYVLLSVFMHTLVIHTLKP